MVSKQNILDNVAEYSAEQLVEYIQQGIVTFDELVKDTDGEFDAVKRKKVKELLDHADELAWERVQNEHTIETAQWYLDTFPNGAYRSQARSIKAEIEKQKEEQERLDSLPSINGIKLAVTPIEGRITSRYGVSSSLRKSTHTGLDIAAVQGTDIHVIADGTVTSASYNGAYGNLVKVDHGNGVETWYAHTSKMLVKKGNTVKAGDIIAKVGSTGNSTGPHLHLEIRINGEHVNPQNYLYK